VRDGVPYNRPVARLKYVQAGLLAMLKLSESPSGSDAVGRNEYERDTVAVLDGVPEMVGARLVVASVEASAAIASCASIMAGAKPSRAVQRNLGKRLVRGRAAKSGTIAPGSDANGVTEDHTVR